LGMSWILPMLHHLRRKHPRITFHLYFGSGSDILLRVRSGEIDCAVGSMRVDDPKLDSVALHREDYVLVGAPRLLARAPLRRASDAREHTLIDERPALPLYAYWRDAVAVQDRLSFRRIVYFGTIAAMRAAVLAGEGVAVLPSYLVSRDLDAHRLVHLLPRVSPLHDYFRLIFRGDDPRHIVYQALAESMREVAVR
jgi:LysR family transcriptional regulator, glycine cleavage system transcriptional activator